MRQATRLMGLAAALVLAAGCAEAGPAAGSGADVVDTDPPAQAATDSTDTDADDPGTDDAEADDQPQLGTRDNPLAIGTVIRLADWELAVVEVRPDATEDVLAANQFNDPPAEGRQFMMWRVEATYVGDDAGDPMWDFSWAVVGSAGNTFGTSMDDHCGSYDNRFDDGGETFPGGSVSGWACVSVASDQVDGATIRVEELMSFDDTRAFYATS
jgi:hypothetical protein